MTILKHYAAIIATIFLWSATPAYASVDKLLDGGRQCSRYFPSSEKMNGVPEHLLAAISSAESGRYHKGLGLVVPWPWTINAAGKGYYFDSKEAAIAKARELQRQGIDSMDVGCMQINLKHHKSAFRSLDEAFDPRYNVAYASRFLREKYEESRNWQRAAAWYHSKTPQHGNRYAGRVMKLWHNIQQKVKAAGGRVDPVAWQMASNGGKFDNAASSKPAAFKPRANTPKVINVAQAQADRQYKMRSRSERQNGVLIVRPANGPEKRATVQANPEKARGQFNPAATRSTGPLVTSMSATSGAHFVFP